MTREADFDGQMKAACNVMETHDEALSALAVSEDQISEEFRAELEIARAKTEKYKTAYRTLAK